MKKLLLKILLCFVIAAVPAAFFAACSCKKTDSGSQTTSDFVFRLTQEGYVVRSYNGKSTNIVIPSSYKGKNVVAIGSDAFSWCDDITSIEIPSTITKIGEGAFSHCASLQSITIPSSVKTIQNNAFDNCASLSSVTFADGSNLETIEENAFANCYSLSSITLPAKLSSISPNAFYGCSKLESLSVDSANQTFDSRNNCNALIETETNTLVLATKSTRSIPNTVEKIGDNAFYGSKITSIAFPQSLTKIGYQAFAYSNLTSVSISSNITEMGEGAFYGCENLASVTFDAACTLAEIPSSCFEDCHSLTSITIPDSVETISYEAFRSTGLTSVSFGQHPTLKTIGECAFEYSSSLTSITIPASVTTIDYEAFYSCENLAEIILAENSSLQKIGYNAFYYTAITSFTIPATVTELEEYAFNYCQNLEVVTFDTNSTLATIPSYCFRGCRSLNSVTAPQIVNIGEYAFYECSRLSSFNLDNVGYIDEYAFSGTGLTSVTIKEGVYVDYCAFSDCESLASVVVEEGVIEIPNRIFESCNNLTSVSLPSTLTTIGEGAFESCYSLNAITLPESIQQIGSGAFAYCSSLTSITIPSLVEVIAADTFYSCSNLFSITLPVSLTTIEYDAFCYCNSLEEITIPAKVSDISSSAFSGCYNLSTVYVESEDYSNASAVFDALDTIKYYTAITVYVGQNLYDELNQSYSSYFTIEINNSLDNMFDIALDVGSQSYVLSNYKGATKDVVIPKTYAGLPITKIAADTFKNSSIESVNIPSTITEVGKNAFEGCSKLAKITVETEDDAVLPVVLGMIAGYEFDGDVYVWDCMKSLAQATKTADSASYSIKTIDDSMFSFSKTDANGNVYITGFNKNNSINKRTDLYIPATHEGHKIIGIYSYAFENNGYIVSLSFSPKSQLEDIASQAFYGCSNLSSISLPSTLTTIGDSAFSGAKIASLQIPAETTYIAPSAFQDCSLLTEIVVDPSCTKYDSRDDCNAVIETATNKFIVTCKNTTIPLSITEISDSMFYGATFTSFTIPSHITRIGSSAFASSNLTSITIPASVTTIDYGAFASCYGLNTITFENGSQLATIGNSAFNCCSNSAFTSITIPASVTTIGDGAFSSCYNLSNIYFETGSTLQQIGKNAFSSTAISSIYIPALVQNISVSAFSDCSQLQTINVDPSNTYYSVENGCLIENSTSTLMFVLTNPTEFEIPSGIKVIGEYAFSNKSIQSITIPEGVTTISSYAFYYCQSLASITIPASVVVIGNNAFADCNNLASLTFAQGSKLQTIGEHAFENAKITTLVLPEGLTSLGWRAFAYCNRLQTVTIPSTLIPESYQQYFADCNSISYAKVLITDSSYIQNILYNNYGDLLYYLNRGDYSNKTLEVWDYLISYIPKPKCNVVGISFESIISIELVDETKPYFIVTGLAEGSQETVIDLPNEYTKDGKNVYPITKIGENAFKDNTTITSVTLPSKLTTISAGAFSGCSALQTITIPSTVSSIGANAFLGCTSLTEIAIPAGITSLEGLGLNTCTSLSKITLYSSSQDTLKFLCDQISAFFTSSDKQVEIVVDQFEALSEYCTAQGYNFTLSFIWSVEPLNTIFSFSLDNGTYSITSYSGSASVVYIPDEYNGIAVTRIGNGAIDHHSGITRIVLPSTITEIGDEAFYASSSLSQINLPSGLKTIGSSAFYNTSLTSISIPASVTSIGSNAFAYCSSLSSISVEAGNTHYASTNNCLIEISTKTLLKATSSFTIPTDGSVEIIGAYAFYGTSISQITIPNTIKIISKYAFAYCENLLSVTIPASVISLGDSSDDQYSDYDYGHTFYNCYNLSTLEFESGINLAVIPNHAFYGTSITSLVIPASVTTIGSNAFYGVHEKNNSHETTYGTITSLSFEAGSNLKTIGTNAFYYQYKLTLLTLPEGVTTLGSNAFSSCLGLQSISLPSTLSSIGDGAFSGCTSLTTISVDSGNTKYSSAGGNLINTTTKTLVIATPSSTIPTDGSVVIIGAYAFADLPITQITIPQGITTIESYAFARTALENVVIPSGVTTIGSNAFYACRSLKTVVLPQGLTTIGYNAFYDCNVLSKINIPASVTSLGDSFVSNSSCEITVETTDTNRLTSTILPALRYMYVTVFVVDGNPYDVAVRYKNSTYCYFKVEPIIDYSKLFSWSEDSEHNTATITGYNGTRTEIEIPSKYNGYAVRIGENAFSNASLVSITFQTEEKSEIAALATDLNTSGFTTKIYVWDSVYSTASGFATAYQVYRIDDSKFSFTNETVYNPETQDYDLTGNLIISRYRYIYSGDYSAEKVYIPSTHMGQKITQIGKNAFSESSRYLSKITFSPKSELTSIQSYAFNWSELPEIEGLPSTLTYIGEGAFYGCDLTSIDLSACINLTKIDNRAFYDCSYLQTVVLPSSIQNIGSGAFYNCPIKTINFPESLTTIGGSAFYGAKFTTLSIYSTIQSMDGAFQNCSNIQTVELVVPDGGSPSTIYSSPVGSNLIINLQNNKVVVSGKNPVLPTGITSLIDYAFVGNTSLEQITLPNTITSIGAHAFDGCSSLTQITIPASVKTIGAGAFANCSSLTSITFESESQLVSIGAHAFSGCNSLTSIDLSVCTSLVDLGTEYNSKDDSSDGFVFAGCSNLTQVILPSSIQEIGKAIFSACNALTTLQMAEEQSSIFYVQDGCLVERSTKTAVATTKTFSFPQDLFAIGDYCCYNTNIGNTTIPNGVTTIGAYAFGGAGISSITIPASVQTIGDYAFGGSITELTFAPNSNLTTIGKCAFESAKITSVTIPASVVYLDGFSSIDTLQSVTFEQGSNLVELAGGAFDYCYNLTQINLQDCNELKTIQGNAFFNCRSLSSLILPNSVESIGSDVFYNCAIQSLTLPKSLKSLNKRTFRASHISSITALFTSYSTLQSVVFNALSSDYSGTIYIWDSFVSDAQQYISDHSYGFSVAGVPVLGTVSLLPNDQENPEFYTVVGIAPQSTATDIDFPGVYNSLPITTIGQDAFKDNTTITSVTLPSSISTIESGAFSGCTSLVSITLPSTIASIGANAFLGCTSLTEITIPASITNLSSLGLDTCTSLSKITLLSTNEEELEALCDQISDFFTSSSKKVAIIVNLFDSLSDYCTTQGYGFTPVVLWAIEPLQSIWSFERNSTGYTVYNYHGSDTNILYVPGEYNGIPVTKVRSLFGATEYSGYHATTVVLPSTITEIGDSAFQGLTTLTQINFPAGLTTIGSSAFAYCGFTSITIPASVTSLGTYQEDNGYDYYYGAFYCCFNLTSVTFEAGTTIKIIPNRCFESTKISSITIPASVETIGYRAFCGYGYDSSNYQTLTQVEFELGSALKQIDSSAFSGQSNLTSISLPSGLQKIGSGAFASTGLTSITIPASVTSIANGAFELCADTLTTISVEAGNTTFSAAGNCLVNTTTKTLIVGCSTSSIPSDIQTIAACAFAGSNISSVTLPSTVTSIGSYAFASCLGLTTADLSACAQLTLLPNDIFNSCTNLESVILPNSITSIGGSAFSYCANLSTINFPTSLTTIESYAFHSTHLAAADLSACTQLTTIGNQAFYGISSLTSVVLPQGLTTLSNYVFNSCSNLHQINIPASVTSLGDRFVSNSSCEITVETTDTTRLSTVLYRLTYCWCSFTVKVWDEVYSFAQTYKADHNSYFVLDIIFDLNTVFSWETDSELHTATITAYNSAKTNPTIPAEYNGNSVVIGQDAFKDNTTITTVTLEEGITTILSGAFSGCTNLVSVSLPSTITTIGQNAFESCSNLSFTFYSEDSAEVSAAITLLRDSGYTGTIYVWDIIYSAVNPQDADSNIQRIESSEFSLTFSESNGGYYTISGYSGSQNEVIIPSTHYNTDTNQSYPITGIGYEAFYHKSIKKVTFLPNSQITTIDSEAFQECYSLQQINLPSTVNYIGSSAFYNCNSLTQITIPASVTTINSNAFYSCYNLATVTFLGNAITSIGSSAFYDCNNLQTINLADLTNLTSINDQAFYGCDSLERITIPASVTTIDSNAFSNCSKLSSISFESNCNLSTIGSYAFSYTKIASFTLPASVTSVSEGNIFRGCPNLTSISVDTNNQIYDSHEDCNAIIKTQTNQIVATCATTTIPSGVTTIPSYAFANSPITSITIPSSVTSIGYEAFRDSALSSITIPASVTEIGVYAFYSCQRLTSVTFEAGSNLISLASHAFMNCFNLSSINLQNCSILQTISDYAFCGCNRLTSITLPSSLTSIGSSTFKNCTSLTSITIPASVATIGSETFYNCSSLSIIEFESGSQLASIPYGCFVGTAATQITIPAAVTSISRIAFNSLSQINLSQNTNFIIQDGCLIKQNGKLLIQVESNFVVPSDIQEIGESCFSGASFSEFTIPSSVTTISASAFYNCDYLTSITIPASVITIGNSAFDDCNSLQNLSFAQGSKLQTIGSFAFESCRIPSVTIPATVTSIGNSAFNYCTNLSEVVFEIGSKLQTIGSVAFQSTTIQNLVLPEGLTSLGYRAFCYCNSLQSVVIPSSLSSIDSQTFGNCNSLTYAKVLVTSESVLLAVLGNGWFSGIGYYLNLNENSTLEVWDYLASYAEERKSSYNWSFTINPISADSIVSLEPNTQENPEYYIITGYVGVGGVVTFPNTYNSLPITTIGQDAFKDSATITSLILPSNISTIESGAFSGCTNLVSILLPSTIASIGADAFSGCTALKSISLPSTITSIGTNAFSNCTSLTEITIPASITNLSGLGLDTCTSLSKITLLSTTQAELEALCDQISAFFTSSDKQVAIIVDQLDSLSTYCYTTHNYGFSLTKIWTIGPIENTWGFSQNSTGYTITGYSGSASTVYVPEEYNGRPVTNIAAYLFQNNSNITHVVLPSTIIEIGYYAFHNCANLAQISIPASVTTIGQDVFDGCSSLQTISVEQGNTRYTSTNNCLIEISTKTLLKATSSSTIPTDGSVEIVGAYAFAGTAIASATIPASVKTISNYAFSNCNSLQSVTFASGSALTTIGNYAFSYCSNLSTLDLSSYSVLTTIGNSAFYDCDALTSITIPASVKTIGSSAFYSSSLKTITFAPGGALETIGSSAFSSCNSLCSIDLSSCLSLTEIGSGAFQNCGNLRTVVLPQGLTTNRWGKCICIR